MKILLTDAASLPLPVVATRRGPRPHAAGETLRRSALVGAVVALLAPVAALAHEVLHQVERGRAVAVRAYESDGGALAHAAYEVYSPADPGTPHQTGRTDRSGWLAFVPDVAGKWRVKVIDDTGHGLDVGVDAAPAASASGATAPAPGSRAALVLRPVAGVAVIAAVFGTLFAVYRRKRSAP